MCIGHIIIQSQAQPVTVLTGDSEAFQISKKLILYQNICYGPQEFDINHPFDCSLLPNQHFFRK